MSDGQDKTGFSIKDLDVIWHPSRHNFSEIFV